MLKKVVILIALSLLFSSCATIFGSRNDEVTFKSKNKVKLTVDSVYVGEGTELKHKLKRDILAKQLIIEADGYKKKYDIVFQDNFTFASVLSYVPFGIFILPPIIDLASPKTSKYDEEYILEDLLPFPSWDSSLKRIYFGRISFDIKKDKNITNIYTYDNYIHDDLPDYTITSDSINYKSTVFEDDMYQLLKKSNYIDTSNTVFFENLNTYYLDCKLEELSINTVKKRYISFIDSEIKGQWYVKDIYGDTLAIDTFKTKSGKFPLNLLYLSPYSSDYSTALEVYKSVIRDAIANSMVNFIGSDKSKKLLKYDNKKSYDFELLKLTKSNKPKSLEDAMKATVTIKSENSHGSGFIVSKDGYIITNFHVINEKENYVVITNDGKEFPLEIVRVNKILDLALLKIKGDFNIAFDVSEANDVGIGTNIFAIGTPKSVELGQTLTKGIISGKRKNKFYNYIQSDASVNSGNSGGPIVTENGKLVSVVEWKLRGVGTEGISFSIPVSDVKDALNLE